MQDETLGDIAAGVTIEVLGFVTRGESGQTEGLGFAAGEERGTVRAGEKSDFAGERADFVYRATVAALLLVEDRGAERLDLDFVEGGTDVEAGGLGILGLDGNADFFLERADGGITLDLGGAIDRAFDAVLDEVIRHFDVLGLGDVEGQRALGLVDA